MSLYWQERHQRLTVLQCGVEPCLYTVRGGTSDFTFYSAGESHVSILSGAAPATYRSTVWGRAMSLYCQERHQLYILQWGGEPVRSGTRDFPFYSEGESHVSILSGAAPATLRFQWRGEPCLCTVRGGTSDLTLRRGGGTSLLIVGNKQACRSCNSSNWIRILTITTAEKPSPCVHKQIKTLERNSLL